MKHKPIVSAEEKHLFSSGFRVTQGDHEFVTYPENTSIRIWHSDEADEYETHFHSAVEVIIPLKGTVHFWTEEEMMQLKEGEIMIVPGGVRHGFRMDADSERELLLYEPNGVFTLKEFSAFRQMMAQPIYLDATHPCTEQLRDIFFRAFPKAGNIYSLPFPQLQRTLPPSERQKHSLPLRCLHFPLTYSLCRYQPQPRQKTSADSYFPFSHLLSRELGKILSEY